MGVNQPNVTVNVNNDSKRVLEIIGTLLLCAAIGMVAWAISSQGQVWVELASTGLTMFLFTFVKMMVNAGLIILPEKTSRDFQQTSGFLRTAWQEFQVWQAKSPAWRLGALALGSAILFLIVRQGISIALLIFTNIWISGAAAAIVGMLIVSPSLIGDALQRLKTKNVVRTEGGNQ
jgi:hypothetical protein